MLNPYKVEFFYIDYTTVDGTLRGNYIYRDWSLVSNPILHFDYFCLTKSQITIPKNLTTIKKGDVAHITDKKGNTVYQGIITEISPKRNGSTNIYLIPLMSWFDTERKINTSWVKNTLEQTITNFIAYCFGYTYDPYEYIPRRSSSAATGTTMPSYIFESDIINFYDWLCEIASTYRIYVDVYINFTNKNTYIIVKNMQTNGTYYELEVGVSDCLEYSIDLSQSNSTNKIVLYDEADPSTSVIYYLLNNNTISTTYTSSTRIIPTISQTMYISTPSGSTFADMALQKATNILKKSLYNNQIVVKVRRESRTIPTNMVIGNLAYVFDESHSPISTILTAWELDDNSITYTFGINRMSLTKKLQMQGRL